MPPERSEVVRTRLMQNSLGLVESLCVGGPRTRIPRHESFSGDFQVCLPYQGAFVWHVGRDDVGADPNRVLFVAGGEGYRISQPIDDGYAELIVTVPPALLADMLGIDERQLPMHPLFRLRSRGADAALQRLGAEGLHGLPIEDGYGLAVDDWLVRFLQAALAVSPDHAPASPSTMRLIARAREHMATHLAAPLRLPDIARAVGASPAYLTDVFKRIEGVPLHRYLVHLRLSRALVELPHANDLTRLAGDLGFSNHSHFTAAFRRAYGCTPSRFRASMRRDRVHYARAATRTRRFSGLVT